MKMQTVEQPLQAPNPPQPTMPPMPPLPGPGGPIIVTTGPQPIARPLSRQEIQAIRERRGELSDQLQSAAARRARLAEQLLTADPAARQGLQQRIAVLDERIVQLERDIASSGRELTMARFQGVTGIAPPMERFAGLDPGQITGISIVFTVLVLFPLAIASARLLWKRATAWGRPLPADTSERLTKLEQAVDTVAVEMERVSEGQRFMTKLLMEPNALAALEAAGRTPERVGARRGDT